MISYKDMTFCSSKTCINEDCKRFFSPQVIVAAKEWWDGEHPPIALSDFSNTCPDYKEVYDYD